MSLTRRQQIVSLLELRSWTVTDLALQMKMPIKELVEHLEHIRRSLRERKLNVEPAECTACGKVFDDRSRLTAPSRCPRCKSERTTEPVLSLPAEHQEGSP